MPRFRSKPTDPVEIDAFQLGCAVNVLLGRGKPHLHGQKGDWLATHADGTQEILTAKQLGDRFEPIEAAAPAPIRRNGKPKARPRSRAVKLKHKAGARATPATWVEALFGDRRRILASLEQLAAGRGLRPFPALLRAVVVQRRRRHADLGEALPGKVRCRSCETWTDRDPCTSCGKKVRR